MDKHLEGKAETLTREQARIKLLAAGALNTTIQVPKDAKLLSDEELIEIGRLAPDARPSQDLIREDRESR